MLIPEFILTKQDLEYLSDKSEFLKESKSNFTSVPVRYFNVKQELFDSFINEKKESYSVKASAIIFTLMKSASSPTDYMALTAAIISLYPISKTYSERLLMLLKTDISRVLKT